MLYEAKLKLVSRILASTWEERRRLFAFPRDDGAWSLGSRGRHMWNGLLANAVSSLGFRIDCDTIRWPRTILLPTIVLHRRNKGRGGGGRPVEILHEAIDKGVVLTFQFLVRVTDGQERLHYPSDAQLNEILQFIGTYEGISPFGGENGYGLFDVKSLAVVGRSAVDLGELPGGVPETAVLPGEEAGAGREDLEEEDNADDPP
jgi:hypothetical protein